MHPAYSQGQMYAHKYIRIFVIEAIPFSNTLPGRIRAVEVASGKGGLPLDAGFLIGHPFHQYATESNGVASGFVPIAIFTM